MNRIPTRGGGGDGNRSFKEKAANGEISCFC